MTLSDLHAALAAHGIELAIHGDQLRYRPVEALTVELRHAIESCKPDLFVLVSGRAIADVGSCESCGADLVGLPTSDGFINRTCPVCGEWFRCLQRTPLHEEGPL